MKALNLNECSHTSQKCCLPSGMDFEKYLCQCLHSFRKAPWFMNRLGYFSPSAWLLSPHVVSVSPRAVISEACASRVPTVMSNQSLIKSMSLRETRFQQGSYFSKLDDTTDSGFYT